MVTIDGPQNQTFISGDRNKFLTCRADCSPACTFTWYKNGRRLWGSGKHLGFRPAIGISDTGNYLCEASNGRKFVRNSTTWYLMVLGNMIWSIYGARQKIVLEAITMN